MTYDQAQQLAKFIEQTFQTILHCQGKIFTNVPNVLSDFPLNGFLCVGKLHKNIYIYYYPLSYPIPHHLLETIYLNVDTSKPLDCSLDEYVYKYFIAEPVDYL